MLSEATCLGLWSCVVWVGFLSGGFFAFLMPSLGKLRCSCPFSIAAAWNKGPRPCSAMLLSGSRLGSRCLFFKRALRGFRLVDLRCGLLLAGGPLAHALSTGRAFRRLGVDVFWGLAVDTGRLPDFGKKIIPTSYSRVNRAIFWDPRGAQESYIDVVSQLVIEVRTSKILRLFFF